MQMIAATTDIRSNPPQFQYVPFPSPGLIAYFDYILGGAPNTSPVNWDDCITDAFLADCNGTGGPTIY